MNLIAFEFGNVLYDLLNQWKQVQLVFFQLCKLLVGICLCYNNCKICAFVTPEL